MKDGKGFVSLSVDLSQVDAEVNSLIRMQSTSVRRMAILAGQDAAHIAIGDYYSSKGRALWINPALSTHGPGRKATAFSKQIETGWFKGSVNGTKATISNSAIGLAHKVMGGTIRAKRAKFLTIPLIPQAHARRAKEFSESIAPLFAAKGCLMMAKKGQKPIPVYALKKSVTHKPWPGALPPEDDYVGPFTEAAANKIVEELSKKS